MKIGRTQLCCEGSGELAENIPRVTWTSGGMSASGSVMHPRWRLFPACGFLFEISEQVISRLLIKARAGGYFCLSTVRASQRNANEVPGLRDHLWLCTTFVNIPARLGSRSSRVFRGLKSNRE